MNIESRFYFEKGLTLHTACAGDEVKNLRYLQNLFGVRLVARDNWVEIHGEREAVERVEALLAELAHFYELRSRQIEARDF